MRHNEDALKSVLKSLRKDTSPLLSPELKQIVEAYQVAVSSVSQDYSGLLVAQALREVWVRELQPTLVRNQASIEKWVGVLIPVAGFLEPVFDDYPGCWTRELAISCLKDTAWLQSWISDKGIVKKAGLVLGSEVSERTYSRWQKQGLAQWAAAIRRSVVNPNVWEVDPAEWLPLPSSRELIQRQAVLAALRTRLQAAVQSDAWVALVGIGGIGKTTLLGMLVRDAVLRNIFPAGVIVVTFSQQVQNAPEREILWQLATRLTHRLISRTATIPELRKLIRAQIKERRALLIMDDVNMSIYLDSLRDIETLTVLVATRMPKVAKSLEITQDWQVNLQGLAVEEGQKLALAISGHKLITQDERQALANLLCFLEGHPLLIRIVAKRAAEIGWSHTYRLYKQLENRCRELGYSIECGNGQRGDSKLKLILEETWVQLSPNLQKRLAQLGQVPLFESFGPNLGMAVWDVKNIQRAEGELNRLVDIGVLQRSGKERYRMHMLIRDFAHEKCGVLSRQERVKLRLWIWRYPVYSSWPEYRWYRFNVPIPPGKSWPIWDRHIPRTPKDKHRWQWLDHAIGEFFWVADDHSHLMITPLEWVIVKRKALMIKSLLCMEAILTMLYLYGLFSKSAAGISETTIILAILLLVLFVLWAWTDSRRIWMWHLLGHSLTDVLQRHQS